MDAGLRMDGIAALDLWDLVIEVLHSSNNVPARETRREMMSDVDNVVTSGKPSHFEDRLYIFEDIGAVIKMINNGRSPTMRHVSRTHRVALDWSLTESTWSQKSKSSVLTPKTTR